MFFSLSLFHDIALCFCLCFSLPDIAGFFSLSLLPTIALCFSLCLSLLPDIAGRPLSPSPERPQGGSWIVGGGKSKSLPPDNDNYNDNDENSSQDSRVMKMTIMPASYSGSPSTAL